MKKCLISFVVLVIIFGAGFYQRAYSQEQDKKNGELTIPWEEFKKLLNLEADDIVLPLETFQKLLAQTGVTTTPAYKVKAGNVILSREEFKKLVDQMKPPVGPGAKPPFDYLITKAVYYGKMGKKNTTFNGNFTVHVLKSNAFLKIPFLPQNIALEDIKVDGKPALVVSDNGYHNVVLSQTGEYTVSAAFSMKSALDKGPHKLDLYIQQTPITLFQLEMPLKNINVEIPQAQQVVTDVRNNKTYISAVISRGSYISVQWRKKLAVTEKIPPKLYGEVYHLVSINDDVFHINSDINYNILHSEVDAVQIAIPENMNVLSVTGSGVGEWQELTQDKQRFIMVPFTYGKKGAITVQVHSEVTLSETGLANVFSGFKTVSTVREIGFMGIELNTSAELSVAEIEGLEKVPPQKLPNQLIRKSAKPLMMGFKYLRHPFSLVLDIKKHEKIAVPVATINSASIVTLFTEDGKVVHRLVYQVRNSAKQFLEIQLPDDADVWSVFVDNQPVESSMNSERKLLVPLIRSRNVNNQLHTFPVEIIMALSVEKFSWYGSRGSSLPAVDLLTSQLIWSVYLPNDYSYSYFNSTLEKEEIIRGLNLFTGSRRDYNEAAKRELMSAIPENGDAPAPTLSYDEMKKVYKGKDSRSSFRNIPMQEEQIAGQMAAEMEFSDRLEGLARQDMSQVGAGGSVSTGVLPIQIKIPTSGQVYRFAKTIINPEDPLEFSVVYTQLWAVSLLKWVFFVVVLLVLFVIRKKLKGPWNWLKERWQDAVKWFQKNESAIKRFAQSKMTPFVLFGLIIIFWPVSSLLTMVLLFLFWVSIVYLVLNFRRKKSIEMVPAPIEVKTKTGRKRKGKNPDPPIDLGKLE
jgi:hypothetical protein